jgi:hypothetical protein
MRAHSRLRRATIAIISVAVMALLAAPTAASARADVLTPHQRAVLHGIAQDTWQFYADDVDPTTHLPAENVARHIFSVLWPNWLCARPCDRAAVHGGRQRRSTQAWHITIRATRAS